MRKLCEIVSLLVFFLFTFGMLIGCTTNKTVVVSTNKFIQTDYEYNCLDGTKTFSQIIVCYQAQDIAEKKQNEVTNTMILQDSKK